MIVLEKPVITEKSMKLAGDSEYTFRVSKGANKLQIAKAVKLAFKVDVLNVTTINVKGQMKNQRKVRRTYITQGFKKAIVRIKKGQIIPIFEAPKEEVTVTTAEGEPQVMKEKKDILRRTKVRIEKSHVVTEKGVMTGKGGDK